MRRTGLHRHGSGIADDAGDPLDGLVNLFDVGIVLAVAFLVAGLGLAVDRHSGRIIARQQQRTTTTDQRVRTLPAPTTTTPTRGQGQEVGKVYRLSDGRLVYVEGDRTP
jgi:hypothetical protein